MPISSGNLTSRRRLTPASAADSASTARPPHAGPQANSAAYRYGLTTRGRQIRTLSSYSVANVSVPAVRIRGVFGAVRDRFVTVVPATTPRIVALDETAEGVA